LLLCLLASSYEVNDGRLGSIEERWVGNPSRLKRVYPVVMSYCSLECTLHLFVPSKVAIQV